jgi:neutral ceramidase
MAGYAARAGASSGVLQPLEVHCVVLAGLPLVVAEVLEIDESLAAAVRERVPGAWVSATHTHAGPASSAVRDEVVAAAADAFAAVREEELTAHYRPGWLEGIGSARNGGGPARVRADVLSWTDEHGRLAGVLAVVPIHPTVLPATSTMIDGDLAGAVRTALRRLVAPAWVVIATGAAGDISTRLTRRAQTPQECRRLGEEAARQLAELLRGPAEVSWTVAAAAQAQRRLSLPARCDDPRELETLRADLQARHARTPDRTLETALQGVEIATSRTIPGEVTLVLAAARLGPLALFGVGGEPFHSLSDALPHPAVVLGYANGHAGYLPDAAAYDQARYEVLASPLRAGAAAIVAAALIDLLPEPTEA